jgi:hypothetical protein
MPAQSAVVQSHSSNSLIRATHFVALDALAVDDRGAGVAFAPGYQADLFPQMLVARDPQPVVLPESKVVVNRAPGSKMFLRFAPPAAGLAEIKDRVEQFSIGVLARPFLVAGFRTTI